MMRVLLIFALLMTIPVQGFASGAGAIKGGDSAVTDASDVSAAIELSADSKPCCKDTNLADNKPTFCKPDCKAVMATVTVPPSEKLTGHRWPHQIADPSYKRAVDLRPPIT